jgi:hypothetical protein
VSAPVLVVSPRIGMARAWARREGLSPRQWHHVAERWQLDGVRGGAVVVVNAHGLPGRAAWEDLLRVLELTGTTVRREGT